jgi:hypothetical protein
MKTAGSIADKIINFFSFMNGLLACVQRSRLAAVLAFEKHSARQP